mgnify:FL=1
MLIIKKFRHYLISVKQSYSVSKLSSTEIKCVKNTLKPELQVIFFSQAMCDQRHGFLVFNKCKELFKDSVDISHEELFTASLLHDVGKTTSFSSVTMRIITALFVAIYGVNNSINLDNSRFSLLRRVGAYANHSEIGGEMIRKYCESDFVYEATRYHHSKPETLYKNCKNPLAIELFIEADNL